MTSLTAVRGTVVIMNLHYTGLGIARSLAGLPLDVVGVGADRTFFGGGSRHVRFLHSPDSALQPEACLRFLLDLAPSLRGPVVLLPTRDQDIDFIRRFREQLAPLYRYVAPGNDVLEQILDKAALHEIAAECGVSSPVSFTVESMQQLAAVRPQLVFPCIVKPLTASHWRAPKVWEIVRKNKAMIVKSWEELSAFYGSIVEDAPLVLIQEFIGGGDSSLVIFGSYRSPVDRSLTYFTGRKLLQWPPLTGSGVAVECKPIEAVIEPSRKLLERLDYIGVSEIEYKIDHVTGALKLIEINPRHWDQHSMGAVCGVDVTRALAHDVFGTPAVNGQQSARPAVWLAEDRYGRLIVEQLRTRSFEGSMHRYVLRQKWVPAVMSWRDPGPFMRMLGNGLRAFGRRVVNLVRPRGAQRRMIRRIQ
jgi:predicted ATP-grasp superfamily ATP-dependent carboligase